VSAVHESPKHVGGRRSRLAEPDAQRMRLMAATRAFVSEQGHLPLTVAAVCGRAGISRRTFYEIFSDASDVLTAVIEETHELLWAEIDWHVREVSSEDRPTALCVGIVAFLAVLEARPDYGRLCVVEPALCYPRARDARRLLTARLASLADTASDDMAAGSVGGLWELVFNHLAAGGSDEDLPGLAGRAIYLVLAPHVGRVEARRLAADPPVLAAIRSQSPESEVVPYRLTTLARRTLLFLSEHPLAISAEIGEGVGIVHASQISRHLAGLEERELLSSRREGRCKFWSLTELGVETVAALRGSASRR
jgi:AcrR family transcriptional regulator